MFLRVIKDRLKGKLEISMILRPITMEKLFACLTLHLALNAIKAPLEIPYITL